jgi:hypothetical protein
LQASQVAGEPDEKKPLLGTPIVRRMPCWLLPEEFPWEIAFVDGF